MRNNRNTNPAPSGLHCRTRLQLLLPAAETQAAAPAAGTSKAQASGARYALEGLTCGHCVQTVEKAVSRVSGVQSATVDLVPGGTSRLSVTGTVGLETLTEAVRSSGYVLTGAK